MKPIGSMVQEPLAQIHIYVEPAALNKEAAELAGKIPENFEELGI